MTKDRKIDIMGIINATDDSFFAGSRVLGIPDSEISRRIGNMVQDGATIIDIGGCSTRPGAAIPPLEEEWLRLRPVVGIASRNGVRFSVDTFRSEIVRRVYDMCGDFIVNDISAGEDDEAMLSLVGSLGLEYVAMHKRGTPETMSLLTHYDDVTADVLEYFREFETKAAAHGIKDWILDPGFGFAKTIEQNYELLRNLQAFMGLSRRVLVGVSRKSMIYKALDITPEESLPATQVLHLYALQQGASILRVHDVAEAARTVRIWRHLN